MPYTDGMDVALNWEDLAAELRKKWFQYEYPINFGETSGLVEYDEWFSDKDGNGSMIQFVIDACNEAEVTPFFLTKIRYPQYLRFQRQGSSGYFAHARVSSPMGGFPMDRPPKNCSKVSHGQWKPELSIRSFA